MLTNVEYLLWFNFILGFNFIFLRFQTHYHTLLYPKKKSKLKPRIKLNNNITRYSSSHYLFTVTTFKAFQLRSFVLLSNNFHVFIIWFIRTIPRKRSTIHSRHGEGGKVENSDNCVNLKYKCHRIKIYGRVLYSGWWALVLVCRLVFLYCNIILLGRKKWLTNKHWIKKTLVDSKHYCNLWYEYMKHIYLYCGK